MYPGRRATRSTPSSRAATRTFVLVDTAGLRRKRRQRQGIEYYSELRALEAAERADVSLVLVDASEGVVEQDLAVADVARKAGCSTLVVLSKWDIGVVDLQETRGLLNRRLRQRPPAVAVSAATGRGLRRLLDHVEALFVKHVTRIPTPALNRALGRAEGGSARAGGRARQAPQAALRDPDRDAPAAAQDLRQRPEARHARLRLLGRERAARPLRAAGRAGLDRLPALGVARDSRRPASRARRVARWTSSSSAGGRGERRSRGSSPTTATPSRSRAATPPRSRRSRRPGTTRATSRTSTSAGSS